MSRPGKSNVVFGTLLLLGSLGALGLGVPGVLGARADEELVSVEGQVIEVSAKREMLVVRAASSNAPTHETWIHVSYAYGFGGSEHTNDVYGFDEPREGITDEDEANARVEALRSSDTLEVWVDPEDPTRSVLRKREIAPALVVSGLGGLALVIGCGLLVRWGMQERAWRRMERLAAGTQAGGPGGPGTPGG